MKLDTPPRISQPFVDAPLSVNRGHPLIAKPRADLKRAATASLAGRTVAHVHPFGFPSDVDAELPAHTASASCHGSSPPIGTLRLIADNGASGKRIGLGVPHRSRWGPSH